MSEIERLRDKVEILRLQRDGANSRTLRMWERAKAAEARLRQVEALAAPGVTPDGEPLPEWVSVDDLRAALAAEAEVERLREQVKQLQYDLLLGPKPAEVTPPAEQRP
jgi:hypothetical protein